ncbi:hypothetical protein [Stenotrophomonas mori]|uniref:Magnesium transporter n=1 Tax=Stenotrophomonas mori TaxID=2871096 RepID=A0ABT0SI18_9GAMM|nr:hypothetical protein [Stenotrophomonas mori]MCL7714983.1 hypothetical protein [Stenotrophomonas mori]
MLFRILDTHSHDVLQRALRAAVAAHRPAALRALLHARGERAFARALGDLSGRVVADALSMLPAAARGGVLRHLPRAARKRLHEIEGGDPRQPVAAHRVAWAPRLFASW